MTIENALILNVSELESPLPLHKILQTIRENSDNKTIIVIHRIEPLGLYPHLKELGMKYSCLKKDSEFIITIWKDHDSSSQPND